jgi:hypothetical protein
MKMITRETIKQVVALGQDGEAVAAEFYRAAFNLVADKVDWKGPINAFVRLSELRYSVEVIVDAVEFMTATKAVFTFQGDRVLIQAPGYRAGPAN